MFAHKLLINTIQFRLAHLFKILKNLFIAPEILVLSSLFKLTANLLAILCLESLALDHADRQKAAKRLFELNLALVMEEVSDATQTNGSCLFGVSSRMAVMRC